MMKNDIEKLKINYLKNDPNDFCSIAFVIFEQIKYRDLFLS